jgi:hypothetical protein
MTGAQPARSPDGSSGAALNPPETEAEVAELTSPAVPSAPPARKNGNAHTSSTGRGYLPATDATPLPPTTSGPLIGDVTEDGATLPGIAGLPSLQRIEPTPDEAARSFRARRRLTLWVGLLLLLLLLIGETLLLSPWTDRVAGQPPRQAPAIPLTEVNPYGVNVFLHKEVDRFKREKTLDMAHDMGAVWIKQQFPWNEIEFAKGSFWDPKNNQSSWDKFDNIVDLAQQRGLRIIARIDGTPDWARADDSMSKEVRDDLRGHKGPPSASHMTDFSDFIKVFIARYRGRIAAIQIWNEPNLKAEWYPDVNAREYVNLLYTAFTAAKEADPNVIILAAPLATTNETIAYAGNLNELDYLQAMYNEVKGAGMEPPFDAMSANAYGLSLPPEDAPARDKLNFRRVELLHRVMAANGDGAKAVWFNEYGWNASPENCCQELPWGRVTSEQQADYTVRGIQYAREHWPWAGLFTIWYLRQVGDISPTQSEYYFGLANTEFVPSQAYKAVRKVAHDERQVAAPGQWGPLSPVVWASPHWNDGLSLDVPGGIYVTPSASAVISSDSLQMLFQGTDVKVTLVPSTVSALSSTDAIQARYYVTVDGATDNVASTLPRDPVGHAYIDLPPGAGPTEVTVVSGLGAQWRTGQHELRITAVSLEGNTPANQGRSGSGLAAPLPEDKLVALPGIALLTVEVNRSYLLFAFLTMVLIAGAAYLGWSLWHSRPMAEPVPARSSAGSGSAVRR